MLDWSPLGELAVLVRCGDETAAASLARRARQQSWPVDVVQAYATVAVFFSRPLSHEEAIARLDAAANDTPLSSPRRHTIPVCYERGLDFERIAHHTGLPREDVIARHAGVVFTVYAIGFCPGFPYLGYLPRELSLVPRLDSPRLRVPAGSVGLTGRQTGIYTEPRPGGWNIIGQTPLTLVDVADGYFPLQTGDEVVFEAIGTKEFEEIHGRRLPV